MELYIVRHGIAIDREDPKCPADPERYLTEEGIAKTKLVAKGVAALGATADEFFSSPYVRASSVFCFGHAPQLDEAVAYALGSKRLLTALKKAGVAMIELKRVSPPSGVLIWLATPKLLKRAGK